MINYERPIDAAKKHKLEYRSIHVTSICRSIVQLVYFYMDKYQIYKRDKTCCMPQFEPVY
jgi:hypothetical protein